MGQFDDQVSRGLQIWIAGSDERDEALLAVMLECFECVGDSTQEVLPQRTSEPPAVAGGYSRTINRPLPQAVLTSLCPLWLFSIARYRYLYRHGLTNSRS